MLLNIRRCLNSVSEETRRETGTEAGGRGGGRAGVNRKQVLSPECDVTTETSLTEEFMPDVHLKFYNFRLI